MYLMMDPGTKKVGTKSSYDPNAHTSSQLTQFQRDALTRCVPTDSLRTLSLRYTLEVSAPENVENTYTNTNNAGNPVVSSNGVVQRCGSTDVELNTGQQPRKTVRDDVNTEDDLKGILIDTVISYVTGAQFREGNHDESLWNSIKNKFMSEKNIGMLISKMLVSDASEYDLNIMNHYFFLDYVDDKTKKIKGRVQFAFEQLGEPIYQTLSDIYFWVAQDNGINIISIELTSSDIHTRGLGVCIVEYEMHGNKRKKTVIKPDDKSFEKAVLGKEDSLANDFNLCLENGLLPKIEIGAGIGTLDIKTSNENAHGSAIEYFDHKQLTKIGDPNRSIDIGSVERHIVFASLLGLSDLHGENVVYSSPEGVDAKHRMQFIDAEVGLSYLLSDLKGQQQSATPALQKAMLGQYGGMLTGIEGYDSVKERDINKGHFEAYNRNEMDSFLSKMESKLQGLTARIVPLKTAKLLLCRNLYLRGGYEPEYDDAWRTCYCEELAAAQRLYSNNGFRVCKTNYSDGISWAEKDFSEGRLPFYRLDFSSGEIYHEYEGSPRRVLMQLQIGESENFLEGIIEDRRTVLMGSSKSCVIA